MTSYHASLKRKHLQAAMHQTLMEEAESRRAWLRAELDARSQSLKVPQEEEEEKVELEEEEKEEEGEEVQEEDRKDKAEGGSTKAETMDTEHNNTVRRAKWKAKAEEINALVARAFKVAYASLRSKNQFYELVQELNQEQEAYFKQLTEAAEAGRRLRPEDLLDKQPLTSPDRVRGFVVGQGRVWAKQEAGKIQHKLPTKITGIVEPTVNNQYRPTSVTIQSPVAPPSTSASDEALAELDEVLSSDHDEWSGSLPAEEGTTISGISIGTGVSTEGGGEGEAAITPTAPPMTPGEISGQQELVTKQTQKCRPLPPAPYYSIERADEWSVNSLTAPNTDALRIIPEADANGCHILLQDETAPPGLREKMASAELQQRGTPGQILLQDGVAPPQYVYGGQNEDEDGELGDGYSWGFDSNDLNCDTYRDSEYSERDSFDYSRSYAILEQFINATVDSAGSIDEWMDPDLRLTPTERDAPSNMFDQDSLNGDTINRNDDEDTLKLNNRDKQDDIDDDTLKSDKSDNAKPQNDNPPKIRPQPAPRRNIPCQKKGEDNNRDSAKTEYQIDDIDGKMRPQPAPRQLRSGQKSPTSPHSSHSSLTDSATQTSLKNGELVPPKQLALINGQPDVPDRPNSMKGLNSPVSSPKVDNTQRLTSPRAPGHSGHKVEIEIGKFRCKRSPSHGAAPPLPPRSTSLHGDNRSSAPVVKDIEKAAIVMKDIEQATWFKAAIPREIAVEILQQEEKGAFIVRESKSHPGCFALSMKVDKDFNESGIANYLVVRTKNGGYTIKGFGRDFPDLPRLIHHYSLQREQLPCCLELSRNNPLYEQEEDETSEDYTGDDEDLDYMSLTDFHSVMEGMEGITRL